MDFSLYHIHPTGYYIEYAGPEKNLGIRSK